MTKKLRSSLPEPATAGGIRWRFDEFTLDEGTRELRRDGRLLKLEPKPLDALMLLLRHAGELVGKDELIERLWSGRAVTDNVIARCIGKLREALEDEGQQRVRTVHGFGYRYVGAVELDLRGGAAPAASGLVAGARLPLRPLWILESRLEDGAQVWLARHEKTGQARVFKFAPDRAALATLKREVTLYRFLRESLADPSELVEILDWNLDIPPWFLEVAYEPGGSLAQWCERRGGPLAVPLPLRVELLAQAAEAVARAHAVGVLHKDLKPANLLVREPEAGVPRIVLCDFGTGQVELERLQALGITQLGLTRMAAEPDSSGGTLLYTAPEVLAGRPFTIQSDLYALGVMLYQLVVGDLRRPLAPGWEREVEDELLRADIAGAADGNPAHRMGNADELARRLRQLESRRLLAQRERERERLQREAIDSAQQARRELEARRQRRNAWRSAALAATLGLAASLALYHRANVAEQRARTAAQVAESVNRFLNEELLAAANPYQAGGGRSVTVLQVLDTAAKKHRELVSQQPAVAVELGLTIGRAYYNLSLLEPARQQLEPALATSIATLGPQAELTNRLRLQLAEVAWKQERLEDAERLYGEVRAAVPPRSLEDFRARTYLAWVAYLRGDYPDCLRQGQPVVADLAAATQLELRRQQGALADLRWTVAECHLEMGQFEAAQSELDLARGIYVRFLGADNAILAWLDLTQVHLLATTERWEQAALLALDAERRAAAQLSEQHSTVLHARYLLARTRLRQGRPATVVEPLERLYRAQRDVHGERNHVTHFAMHGLGEALLRAGRAQEAHELLARTHRLSTEVLGAAHPYALDIARTLGEALMELGQLEEAAAVLQQTIDLSLQVSPTADRALGRALLSLSCVRSRTGQHAQAAAAADRALQLFEARLGTTSAAADAARRARLGDHSQRWVV